MHVAYLRLCRRRSSAHRPAPVRSPAYHSLAKSNDETLLPPAASIDDTAIPIERDASAAQVGTVGEEGGGQRHVERCQIVGCRAARSRSAP